MAAEFRTGKINRMNRLEKTVQKLDKYPKWILSKAIGSTVKFVGTAGTDFEEMTKDRVIVSLKNRKKVRNHIGQIHAAAMVLIAETATGMVVGMNVPDDKLPLMKKLEAKYVRRSKGRMRAEAWLTEEQKEQIRTQEKGEVLVPVKVTDESGEEPVICQMLWAWIPKKRK